MKQQFYYRWFMALIVCFYLMSAFLTQSYIGQICKDLTDSSSSGNPFSWVIGAFGMGYLIGNVVFGFLADRYSNRTLFAFTCAFWSLLVITLPLIQSSSVLASINIFSGFATGGAFILANSFAKSWIGISEQGRFWGLVFAVISLAFLIGSLGAVWAISRGGWGSTSFVLFLIGAVVVGLILIFYDEKLLDSKRVGEHEKEHFLKEKQIALLGNADKVLSQGGGYFKSSVFLTTAWAFFFWGLMLYFGISWFPSTVIRHSLSGLSIENYIFINRVSIIAGGLFSGWYSDHLFFKYGDVQSSRTNFISLAYILATFFGVLSLLFFNPMIAVTLSFISFFCFGAAHPLLLAVIQSTVFGKIGFKMGVTNATFALGAILSPFFVNLIDATIGNAYIGIVIMAVSGGITSILVTFYQKPNSDIAKYFK